MGKMEQTLKAEITRLAKRQVRAMCLPLVRDVRRLKRTVSAVMGRPKPASAGRLKTSHFEEFAVRHVISPVPRGAKEGRRGESAQNGDGGSDSGVGGAGLVAAADRP